MAKEDKFADEMLTDDELDQVAGGWFWQGYDEDQLKAAGVTWTHNNFSADKFSYKGKSITSDEVEAVTTYFITCKKQPSDTKEATKWYSEVYKNSREYKHMIDKMYPKA